MAQALTLPPLVRGEWIPMSYEEFERWAADRHGEWVDGKGILFVSGNDRHQWIIDLVHGLISRLASIDDLGQAIEAPFAMRFWRGGPHREPDVLFVRKEHLDRWRRTGVMGAADLVVEVISDDSEERDLVDKMAAYAELGVPEYLVIDSRQGRDWFGFYRLDADRRYVPVEPDAEGRFHSLVLPGLWFRASWFRGDALPPVERLLFQVLGDRYLEWILQQRNGAA